MAHPHTSNIVMKYLLAKTIGIYSTSITTLLKSALEHCSHLTNSFSNVSH